MLFRSDEIARQKGISYDTDSRDQKNSSTARRKAAFQNMLEMREQSTYPKDFDYKKAAEEAIREKYNLID